MIVLDTNVVSEIARKEPNQAVIKWLASQQQAKLYLTSISVMEIYFGAFSLPTGKRRTSLESKIGLQVSEFFADRILSFDLESSRICADLMAKGKARTPSAKMPDYQIAAIAIRGGHAVATRNMKDFRHEGLTIINPWTD